MTINESIIPSEYKRIKNLSDLDLDYGLLQSEFQHLTKLAASIAGTKICVINLIDAYMQWTVSEYGLETGQRPREDSVCNFTIQSKEYLEIRRLDLDERFKDKDHVSGPMNLKYYLGLPLTTSAGYNIGALCLMDRKEKAISEDKIQQLKIIAQEIIKRLELKRQLKDTRKLFSEALQTQKKLAHDIRGPLGGIMELAKLGHDDLLELMEMKSYLEMIAESSSTLLELTDEILRYKAIDKISEDNKISVKDLVQKIISLCQPQALFKNVQLIPEYPEEIKSELILKDNLLQIIGNLVSNAIKFSPENGKVAFKLNLSYNPYVLKLKVQDWGAGFSDEQIESVRNGESISSYGSFGEMGYGLGLQLVNTLVKEINGVWRIESKLGEGSTISVEIPQV